MFTGWLIGMGVVIIVFVRFKLFEIRSGCVNSVFLVRFIL